MINVWVYCVFAVAVIAHLWLFFRDGDMVAIKVCSSLVMMSMVVLLAMSYSGWLGWPAQRPHPHIKYTLVNVIVRETTPTTQGKIFLWMIGDEPLSANPFSYWAPPATPRAYEIPFTAANEKAMQRASQGLRGGARVTAEFGDGEGVADDETSNDATGRTGGVHGHAPLLNGRDAGAPEIIVEEPDRLPQKDQ